MVLSPPAVARPVPTRSAQQPAVAGFPMAHAYVAHLRPGGDAPAWRPVPTPSRGFDPRWLAGAELDLVHLHAGLAAYDAGASPRR